MAAVILALMESPIQATTVSDCMTMAGHEVHIATSYKKAIGTLKNLQIDLIISDVHLENGGNVFDFLRWSKEHPKFHSIPFVFLSLNPSVRAQYLIDGVRVAARALGASRYISMKTLEPDFLNAEIQELLTDVRDKPEGEGR